ncbi:hypothetical protein Taro_028595 [Colocasia esculenta]|uniref:Uncharacterized protein n=1 Tax=Colocasia esculenta TaxID=4460 RepID=A0A843VJ10_COLES|nr:hypothetical protein [Colocasia esculenta]
MWQGSIRARDDRFRNELQVDVAGEIASLHALLHSAVQDREVAQREAEQLRRELDRVRRAEEADASSSRAAENSQSDLEDRLAAVVRRAEEARAELAEREMELRTATDRATQLQGQVNTVTGERDQLRIRAEAAESRVAEAMRELATWRVQGSSVDQEELAWLHADLHAQQTLARGLQEVMTAIGRSRSRSRSGASGASGATGTSVRQYLAGSSSRRRNEDEERRLGGETSARSGRGGGEMPPPPDRHEGSGESDGDEDLLDSTLESKLGLILIGGSGEVSRGLLEGKETCASEPHESSDGSGGGGGPPELRVPAVKLGCRGTEGPSPRSPKITMVVDRGLNRSKEKAGIAAKEKESVMGISVKGAKERAGDGDRRRKKGSTRTGIAIRMLRTGVTGIAVKQRELQQEVAGIAARSWDRSGGSVLGRRGRTGIAV